MRYYRELIDTIAARRRYHETEPCHFAARLEGVELILNVDLPMEEWQALRYRYPQIQPNCAACGQPLFPVDRKGE